MREARGQLRPPPRVQDPVCSPASRTPGPPAPRTCGRSPRGPGGRQRPCGAREFTGPPERGRRAHDGLSGTGPARPPAGAPARPFRGHGRRKQEPTRGGHLPSLFRPGRVSKTGLSVSSAKGKRQHAGFLVIIRINKRKESISETVFTPVYFFIMSQVSPCPLQARFSALAPPCPAAARAHVWSRPSPRFLVAGRGPLRPARSSLGSGQSGSVETWAPRFLGPPAGAPDCRGREAAWDAEAPGPFRGPWRGRPGGSNWKDARGAGQPRWSQARRWRIFEAHCAAYKNK